MTDFCCEEGRDTTNNLFHLATCRVWDVDRPEMPTGPEDDIGQGEGCEGGKCERKEKK